MVHSTFRFLQRFLITSIAYDHPTDSHLDALYAFKDIPAFLASFRNLFMYLASLSLRDFPIFIL